MKGLKKFKRKELTEMLLDAWCSENKYCTRANDYEYDIKEFQVYLLKKLSNNDYNIKSDEYEKIMRDIIDNFNRIIIYRNDLEGDE